MLDRYFCPTLPPHGPVTLRGDEARHLAQVKRARPGQVVELFDGRGRGCLATVRELGKDEATLELGDPTHDRQAPIPMTIATAVPKGDRFTWLVEKATELGVARLVPLKTERSVVDPRDTKLQRLRRTVIESSKQCGRNSLMDIADPQDLEQFAAECRETARRFATPAGLPASRWPLAVPGSPLAIIVGPEGGLSPREESLLADAGWLPIALGATILRIETACLAAAAAVLARVQDEGAERA